MIFPNLFFIKHKKPFIISLVFLFLLLLFLLSTAQKKTKKLEASPSLPQPPAADFSSLLNNQSKPDETYQSFYLNRVDSLSQVNGYSWTQNQLLYSTPNGIFSAKDNHALLSDTINKISWNNHAQAAYAKNNQWFLFDTATNQSTSLLLSESTVSLHPTLPYLVGAKQTAISVYSLSDTNDPLITLNANKFFWANQAPVIISQASTISIYDLSANSSVTFSPPPGGELQGISADGKIVSFYFPKSQNLSFFDQEGKELQTVNLPDTEKLQSYWLDNERLVTIATSAPDSLGRIIDFIWLVDINGNKKFLANSQPIPNKLNPSIPVYMNADKNVIGLVENNKTIWILSLLPDQFPSYYQESVNFFNPSTKGD